MWVPRKNGKSELAAAIACLFFDLLNPQNGQIILAGPTSKQAGQLFQTVVAMLRAKYPNRFKSFTAHNRMPRRYTCNNTQKEVVDRETNCHLFCLSATGAAHGYNPVLAVVDEIHEFTGVATVEFWSAMQTQFGGQPDGMLLSLTTVGHHQPEHLEQIEFEYAYAVYQGKIKDPHYLPLIYAAPLDADWQDEEVWRAANPALGHHLSVDNMRMLCERAKKTPSLVNEFRRLFLNQRTQTVSRWLNLEAWNACQGSVTLSEACGGLDLSSKQDLTGFALVSMQDNEYHVKTWAWIAEDTAQKHESERNIPYSRWQERGEITLHPGSRINQRAVIEEVVQHCHDHAVTDITVDPWSLSAWKNIFTEEGITVHEMPQTRTRYNEPCKELDAAIVAGKVVHDGNELLAWCVGNADKSEGPNGHIMPVKPSHERKIDPLMAVVMALAQAMRKEAEPAWFVV